MPELLRLLTPEFELSVWANDISARITTYQNTLAKRDLLDQLPAPVVRFAPAQQLDSVTMPAGVNETLPKDPALAIAELELPSAMFFENIQYQFEWVFLQPVTLASVPHRSRTISQAFRFAEQSNHVPARLTGTINTGNDVGWMRLPLSFTHQGHTQTLNIAFEVLPTKMALHQDLPAMYRAIDSIYPLWRFSLVEKTEQDAAQSQRRGHFPLMWLANFGQLRQRFEQGLKVICAAPHSRLQPTVADTKAAKLKGRLPYKLSEQVKQDFANGLYDKRYRVEKKQLSVDTPENRFIKMAVNHSKRQLVEFEQRLRLNNQAPDQQRFSDDFLKELHNWQQPLHKVLNQSFLKEVGDYTGLNRESMVLQQKTGYSAVYRVWQELKFYLDVFSSQSSISMRSVAEIYEVWCFLCLKDILEQDLGFVMTPNHSAKLELNEFFEYQLKDGFAGAFKFTRADGVTARLAHEPRFTKQGQTIRSYLVSQEPDIVLEVTLPSSTEPDKAKRFIWLFDAKYRIKTEQSRFDDDNIDSCDYVPDDAINQMHRYRDALIRLSSIASSDHPQQKSRPVVGAFALYPGCFDQANSSNPYADAIAEIGIGAFALLPSPVDRHPSTDAPATAACGHLWLRDFLREQIGNAPTLPIAYSTASMAERLYIQEAARIPYHGMRQVLYPDLIMTAALGGQKGRNQTYFTAFEQGSMQWYHLKKATFLEKLKHHIADEIRYLALAETSATDSHTKQIDKLWPVKKVSLLPRYAITAQQSGKASTSDEPYYLFELGKPLTLQHAVTRVPHRPLKNTLKLTTLTRLEKATVFAEVDTVYPEALTFKVGA